MNGIKNKVKNQSGFGDGPNDPYMVFESNHGKQGEQQIGCFVLRPSLEPEAFLAIKAYYEAILDKAIKEDKVDTRIDKLRNWLDRLENLWVERGGRK